MRLMNPSHLDTSSAKNLLKQNSEAVEKVSAYFARVLALNDVLLKDGLKETVIREQFLQKLTQIFVDAGRLSIRLWSQRPAFRCHTLGNLAKVPFNVASETLQAHNLHKLDDQEDHSMDGRLTKIMVHPAVLTYGTHEADHYDRHEVLAKAVVWLEADGVVVNGAVADGAVAAGGPVT